jgi:hypothetical protein
VPPDRLPYAALRDASRSARGCGGQLVEKMILCSLVLFKSAAGERIRWAALWESKKGQNHMLKSSFRLLLNTKLVWVFSIISFLDAFLYANMPFSFQLKTDHLVTNVLYLILILAIVVVFATTYGSIVYVIYQASLNQNLSFSEAWAKGKSKLFRILGFLFLWLAIPVLAGICPMIINTSITNRVIAVPLLGINALIANMFYFPFIIIGISAIMISGLTAWSANRIGFLIILNNFFRILVVMAVFALIRILVDWLLLEFLTPGIGNTEMVIQSFLTNAGYKNLMSTPFFGIAQGIITLFVTPWMCVFFTLGYLKYTEEIVYSSLVQKKQPTD